MKKSLSPWKCFISGVTVISFILAGSCQLLNRAPVAIAGDDVVTYIGETVSLDGTGSHDPDGDPITYLWTILTPPPDASPSEYNLNSPTSSMASFTSQKAGPFDIQLTVSDKYADSADSLRISVFESGVNNPPVVSISGVDVSVVSGSAIVGNGVDATFQADALDIDGDTLSYQWYVDGAAAAGETGTSFTMNETPAEETSYSISVRVSDGVHEVESDPVTLTVTAPGNNPPTVSISGVNVTIISGYAVIANGDDAIFQSDASDTDGDTLTYQWYVDGTAVDGETGTTFTMNETPAVETGYSITVSVSDGTDEVESAPVVLTVLAPNYVQHLFGFDGAAWSASADPPEDTISIAGMNGTLYALTAYGEMYQFSNFTSWVLDDDSTVLSDAISLTGAGNSLYVLLGDQQIYVRDSGGWMFYVTAAGDGSVAIAGNTTTIYSLAPDGPVWRLDADWQLDDPEPPAATYSLAATNSTLYALTGTGELYSRDIAGAWALEVVQPPADSAVLGNINDVLYVITVTAE